MKHWAVRFLLCLLLGVVSTVGVAWGAALVAPKLETVMPFEGGFPTFNVLQRDETRIGYIVYRRGLGIDCFDTLEQDLVVDILEDEELEELDQRVVQWMRDNRPPIPKNAAASGPWVDSLEYEHVVSDRVTGWPLRALRSEAKVLYPNSTRGWTLEDSRFALNIGSQENGSPLLASGMFEYFDENTRFLLLPLRPIFPGFYINILVYGTIWFALIFGWRAHVRQIRNWQGYCPMCKYDLRGTLTAGCPECGWGRES